MKPKTLMLLAVAGGCGLLTMLGVQQAMQGGTKTADVPKVEVLVALADIQVGIPLTEDKVVFKSMNAASVPEDAVRTKEEYDDRPLTFPALAGDIIRTSKLGTKGSHGQSAQIPKGWRVVAIPVNETQTVGGLIQPGDRVDVLVTFRGRDLRGVTTTTTKPLLESIEVFSVDARTAMAGGEQGESKARIVSLLVKPEQVAYVKLAESKGTLALSWRHPEDNEYVNVKGIDENLMEELQGTVGPSEEIPMYARMERANLQTAPEPPAAEEKTPESVQTFLDQANAVEAQVPPASASLVPTWKLEIYQKNSVTTQEFELPAEQAPEEDAAAQAAGDLLKGAIHQIFGG